MIKKGIKLSISCIFILGAFLFAFCHSSPERVIRSELFFKGYLVNSFRTEIQQNRIVDLQYGTRYFCKNPAIGPDFYDVDYKNIGKMKFWYINWPGTGGG